MRTVGTILATALVLGSGTVGHAETPEGGRYLKRTPLDRVTIYRDAISKDVPVRVQRFGTENADLGTQMLWVGGDLA